ncbi:hypothetical protein V6N11_075870 [Hibiscus sabdariffa]|uniref:Uncharacterized protein n=1 Tax=Hibiscus sabdariffa TaxID=183260 RepID=A0ABR2Q4K2_9ROSI
MSLIPSIFGNRRSNVFDPFSLDVWDPFKDFPSSLTGTARAPETSALVDTRIDWKETPEAHVCSGSTINIYIIPKPRGDKEDGKR